MTRCNGVARKGHIHGGLVPTLTWTSWPLLTPPITSGSTEKESLESLSPWMPTSRAGAAAPQQGIYDRRHYRARSACAIRTVALG